MEQEHQQEEPSKTQDRKRPAGPQEPQQQPQAPAQPQYPFPRPAVVQQPGANINPPVGYYSPQQPQAAYPGQPVVYPPYAYAQQFLAGHPHAAQMPSVPPAPYPAQYVNPHIGRMPADRPLVKLSVSLIDTYKHINTVYYEERDRRRKARSDTKKQGQGANNNGWDDENYDYIINSGEIFYGRYRIKERIGKGSFGQVVRAEDMESNTEVAIKIIKSKKPFLIQAKTEIELLTHMAKKDPEDQNNIVRLLTHFMYRNHQCLVFEMLSLNLYELLKNTSFGGVSLNLIRKFAKQVLKSLEFLARSDVDIIHCDLKPENILLRHPKKSAVKVIDFGSSCRSNKRMYSYIQSRFYRSPEVILGLPYAVSIDMWSLGCILVEMHTGEPLFSGSDQFDQMQKIVKILGPVPDAMLSRAAGPTKTQFFERDEQSGEWKIRQTRKPKPGEEPEKASATPIVPSDVPVATLSKIVTTPSRQKSKFPAAETYNSQQNYELFIDLVSKMLAYEPLERIKPSDALEHPFITIEFTK